MAQVGSGGDCGVSQFRTSCLDKLNGLAAKGTCGRHSYDHGLIDVDKVKCRHYHPIEASSKTSKRHPESD